MSVRRYWTGIIICLSFGFILRLWWLGAQSYWIDESYSLALAQAIIKHGWPITEAGLLITRSVLYHYLLAAVVWTTGESTPLITRLPAVFFGTATIVVAAAAAKQLFSRNVALVTAVLTATSIWEIAWSRQARMYTALQFGFWLTLYCYVRFRKQQSWRWGLAVLVSAMLTIGFHEFGILVVLIIALHFGIERWFHSTHQLRALLLYCWLVLLIIVAAVLVLRFGFKQPVPVNYWFQYWHYLGTILAMTFIGVLLAVFGLRRKTYAVATFWLATSSIIIVGIFSFAVTLLQYRYIFIIIPAWFMLAAVAIETIWQLPRRRWVWRGWVIIMCLLMVVHQEYLLWPQANYYLESDSSTANISTGTNYKSITPQPDFVAAYQYIIVHYQAGEMVITPYPTIHRLYAAQLALQCIYLDLTGLAPDPPQATERYTNCPYVTSWAMQQELAKGHGYIIIDQFAQQRIQANIRQLIETAAKPVFTSESGEWGRLTLYRY